MSPYTVYSVEVLENLKGNLNKEMPITIEKSGGLSTDGNIYLYEDDILPIEEEYYIIIGYGQPDGSILLTGPSSNIHLDIDGKKELIMDNIVKEYVKAIENEITKDRTRFKSKYEN